MLPLRERSPSTNSTIHADFLSCLVSSRLLSRLCYSAQHTTSQHPLPAHLIAIPIRPSSLPPRYQTTPPIPPDLLQTFSSPFDGGFGLAARLTPALENPQSSCTCLVSIPSVSQCQLCFCCSWTCGVIHLAWSLVLQVGERYVEIGLAEGSCELLDDGG